MSQESEYTKLTKPRSHGQRGKTLTVVDGCSKEATQITLDTSTPALQVTRLLDQGKAEMALRR